MRVNRTGGIANGYIVRSLNARGISPFAVAMWTETYCADVEAVAQHVASLMTVDLLTKGEKK